MRSPGRLLIVLLLFAAACGGGRAETTTTAAQAGAEFEVTWTGPDNEDDYITIVPAGADEGSFHDYFYTAEGPTGTLIAPTTVGNHEIRYVDGATGATVASAPIDIVGREITLELSVQVAAGTEFEVSWEAIEAPGDYITIVPAARGEGTYGNYFNISDGPTGTLVAPMTDGEFEIDLSAASTRPRWQQALSR